MFVARFLFLSLALYLTISLSISRLLLFACRNFCSVGNTLVSARKRCSGLTI